MLVSLDMLTKTVLFDIFATDNPVSVEVFKIQNSLLPSLADLTPEIKLLVYFFHEMNLH